MCIDLIRKRIMVWILDSMKSIPVVANCNGIQKSQATCNCYPTLCQWNTAQQYISVASPLPLLCLSPPSFSTGPGHSRCSSAVGLRITLQSNCRATMWVPSRVILLLCPPSPLPPSPNSLIASILQSHKIQDHLFQDHHQLDTLQWAIMLKSHRIWGEYKHHPISCGSSASPHSPCPPFPSSPPLLSWNLRWGASATHIWPWHSSIMKYDWGISQSLVITLDAATWSLSLSLASILWVQLLAQFDTCNLC